MIRNRVILKSIAVFLILETVFSVVSPTISWALTAGPTAPEATSFEPVDTTDMVNLTTGDFTYNIPLLEVPGPSGGYPLSLAYHAGIMPAEESTWVGLGWSLNPGAINRTVSGFADDFKGVSSLQRSFWQGGSSSTVTVGINVGYAMGPQISAGLVVAEDTYKGFGVGHYFGLGYSGTIGSQGYNVNRTWGVSPYGDKYSSTGVGVGIGGSVAGGLGASLGLGSSTDQNGNVTQSASASVSYNTAARSKAGLSGASLLGASISSGGKPEFSAGGGSASVHSSKAGNVSNSGYNFLVDIPTPWAFSVTLGASYNRYWIDETVNVSTNGALYFPTDQNPSATDFDSKAYDTYDLGGNTVLLDGVSPDQKLAGSYIDYDSYSVLAQGLSGGMRPYHYQAYLLRQNNKTDAGYKVMAYPQGVNRQASFRFLGDFSNRYEHNIANDNFNLNTGDPTKPMSFTFDANRTTGQDGSSGYDETRNVLPGSKAIEYFTNAQISNKDRGNSSAAINKGFIDCSARGFNRSAASADLVGGFMITNPSGVVYHYALPAYSFSECTYQGRVDEKNIHWFNQSKNPAKYAYTWLLTAVTGPDFVDTNLNGLADRGDYGYWVAFDYGLWSSKYSWRTPVEGVTKDVDQSFDIFSKGDKELYYLNTIRTETHTALFVKEIKLDGKGVVHEFYGEAVNTLSNHTFDDIDHGGFDKVSRFGRYEYPASTLKLSTIYLLENKDFEGVDDFQSDLAGAGAIYHDFDDNDTETTPVSYVYGSNIIDIHDLNASALRDDIESNRLNKVNLVTDYSLCAGTINSFTSETDVLNGLPATSGKSGKLTLRSVEFMGSDKNLQTPLIPPIKFNYDLEAPKQVGVTGRTGDVKKIFVDKTVAGFMPGDILKLERGNALYYAYVTAVEVGNYETALAYEMISPAAIPEGASVVFTKTKNPPYSYDAYDLWGSYKVDGYHGAGASPNIPENIKRMTTTVSKNAVDVWSLRSIQSPLGASIHVDYESDVYRNALRSLSKVAIKDVIPVTGNGQRSIITLYQDASEFGLTLGSTVGMQFLTKQQLNVVPEYPGFNCNGNTYSYVYQWETGLSSNLEIVGVDGKNITINSSFGDWVFDPYVQTCVLRDPNPEMQYSAIDCSSTSAPKTKAYYGNKLFAGGELLFNNDFYSPYGGGLRTKSIALKQAGSYGVTKYEYERGVTSYEPLGFAVPIQKLSFSDESPCVVEGQQFKIDFYRNAYLRDTYDEFADLFSSSRELPSPGVLYGLVRVREEFNSNPLPNYSEYEFEVFSPEQLSIDGTRNNPLWGAIGNYGTYTPPSKKAARQEANPYATVSGLSINHGEAFGNSQVIDYTSFVGNLRRVTLFNKDGHKISETVNHYAHDNFPEGFSNALANFSNQGKIVETFVDGRIIVNDFSSSTKRYTVYGVISQKIKYPSIQVGQTVINYKTGIRQQTKSLAFDYYSGDLLKSQFNDGLGGVYLSESTPAYHFDEYYNAMKPAGLGGKNMLTQEGMAYTYKVNAAGTPIGLVSATAQTWSDQIDALKPGEHTSQPANQPGIWRKHASYVFTGDENTPLESGLYPITNGQLPSFNAWADVRHGNEDIPSDWLKTGEITLYDVNSHALEAKDINDRFAATKLSLDQSQVLATVDNATYSEFAYCGAEEVPVTGNQFSGGVFSGGSGFTSAAHTGAKAVIASASGAGNRGFTFFFVPKQRTYHVSVWSTRNNALIKYRFDSTLNPVLTANATNTGSANGWYLLEVDIPVTESWDRVEIWCEANGAETHFDDFRIHPADAAMVSYVYNKSGALSHILDSENLYTEYRYDALGRLTETYRETFQVSYGKQGVVKVSDVNYNYGLNHAPNTVVFSSAATGSTGLISPAGNVNVQQGAEVTFEIVEKCTSKRLTSLTVDGKTISMNGSSTQQLLDGTTLVVSGKWLTFKNVKSGHNIQAIFSVNTALGIAECKPFVNSDGVTCYEGFYQWGYFNDCGEIENWSSGHILQFVPSDLREQVAGVDCCDLSPAGANCDCVHN